MMFECGQTEFSIQIERCVFLDRFCLFCSAWNSSGFYMDSGESWTNSERVMRKFSMVSERMLYEFRTNR